MIENEKKGVTGFPDPIVISFVNAVLKIKHQYKESLLKIDFLLDQSDL